MAFPSSSSSGISTDQSKAGLTIVTTIGVDEVAGKSRRAGQLDAGGDHDVPDVALVGMDVNAAQVARDLELKAGIMGTYGCKRAKLVLHEVALLPVLPDCPFGN